MADIGSPMAQSPIIPLCGTGALAGELEALQAFFTVLPKRPGLAYVIIFHLAPIERAIFLRLCGDERACQSPRSGHHDKVHLEGDHFT